MQLVAGALVFDGNSLTSVVSPIAAIRVNYPALFVQATPPASGLIVSNLAVSGQTTLDMLTRAPLVDAKYSSGPTNIVVAWELTNDIAHGATAQDAFDHMVTYCQGRRAVGWTVVCLTGTPRGKNNPPDAATFEATRQATNTLLRSDPSAYCDALIDVGGDGCVLGVPGAENDPVYYPDTLHLSTLGNQIVVGLVSEVIASLPLRGNPVLPGTVGGPLQSTLTVTDVDAVGCRLVTTHNGSSVLG